MKTAKRKENKDKMMGKGIFGIHHVTAITSDAQRNIDFTNRYQISNDDHMISPDVQRTFAKQMNATTLSLNASHASYVSHPNEIADFILNATKEK